ncbi:hypothetical protein [Maribacter sp. 2308TA10-17]|uniref:hypothetical protein n=1 Tax=Maribacter sp. 2308TA10-17 TaxID=3386276 RepID=UPI0039BC4507
MKNRFKHSINYIAVQIALPSMIVGAICLFLFKNNSNTGFVGIGYFLAIVIGVLNSIMLLPLVVNTIRKIKDYPEHLKALVSLLINIPLSGAYLEVL